MKVIAAGNSFCGDDGVGAAVLDAIRERNILPGVDLVDVQTDALALVELLEPQEPAIVVDAARMGAAPGSVAVLRPDEESLGLRGDHLSLHGLGLPEALALARRLGRLPARLVVIGVEPGRLDLGGGLSEAVRAAVPQVVDIIAAEVGAHG
ncbi:MAG TPA: hydrogenase maturation protease [Candidatus Krumholzibacteria bacterium]|nr:hydrogenase maturation protease [Candidatus Krumholzibacteria bacterium]